MSTGHGPGRKLAGAGSVDAWSYLYSGTVLCQMLLLHSAHKYMPIFCLTRLDWLVLHESHASQTKDAHVGNMFAIHLQEDS